MGAPSLGDVAEAPEDKPPLMVDLFCAPNLPLGKAFLYCGWRCLPVDWALDPSHDLSNPQRQDSIREQLQDAVFAAAALDCSTKSRAGRFRGIWVMASPAPARCGVTATRGHSRLAHGRSASRLQGQFGMQLRPYRAPGLGRPRWGQRSGKPVA